MSECNVTVDTNLITVDSTEVTADGLYLLCCGATADSSVIRSDSGVVTADGYDPACTTQCEVTADNAIYTSDTDVVTADGWNSDCGDEPETPEEPRRSGAAGWGPREYAWTKKLEREDDLIIRVITVFLQKAA